MGTEGGEEAYPRMATKEEGGVLDRINRRGRIREKNHGLHG
jgi:hypothetical protein